MCCGKLHNFRKPIWLYAGNHMCGIFVAINTVGYFGRKDFDRFVSLTDVVRYRGPDGSGYLALNLKDGTVGDCDHFDVFLGHRRLAIIDLSLNGIQPMRGAGRTWLTFNGEIYNYRELKADLKDYPFSNQTDSEVILATYEMRGPHTFGNFNGEWAFAIADLEAKNVILSRDRFSIKPLYEWVHSGCRYYGSEIKQLLPLMPRVELQKDTMFLYLNQGLLDSNQSTFIEGVRHVRSKHNVIISLASGAVAEQRYWSYSTSHGPSDIGEAVQEFRSLLSDSVRLRLRSDVKVGALLSGGLDSSALALLSDRLDPGGVETYSVVSRKPAFSEARFVDALVRHCRIRNRQILVDDSGVVATLGDVIKHNDGPPASFSTLAHYRMMELIRKETDVTVVLTGQGADETLLGYRKFFFFLLSRLARQGKYNSAIRQLVGSAWHRTAIWQFRLGAAGRYMTKTAKTVRPYLSPAGNIEPIAKCADITARQIADIDHYSVPNLNHYEDRNSMAFSLEMRVPFLDHRLVNFALSLKPEYKIRHGWSKYIMREAFPDLPKCIRWRRDKQGFTTPEVYWLRNDLQKTIRGVFENSILEELSMLNRHAFLEYYDEFRAGKRTIWHTDISRVLMAELWARSLFGEPGREQALAPAGAMSTS